MSITLFEHQKRAIARSEKFPFQLIVRSPGTGKTLIGINIVKKELSRDRNSKILWIGPANLERQYMVSFEKFFLPFHSFFSERTIREGCCNFCSFDMLRLNEKLLCSIAWDLVIVDEMHKAKNILTKTNKALRQLRRKARRLYAFTGTPFQNHPCEFFELVSLCLGKSVTVDCEECMEYRFPRYTPVRNFFRRMGFRVSRVNQGPVVGIKDMTRLQAIFSDVVDYLPEDQYHSECHLPRVNFHTQNVEMEQGEVERYRECLRRYAKKRKFRNFLNDKLDDAKIDGFFNGLSGLRTAAMAHSKLIAAIEDVKSISAQNPEARILIFSNFVEKGLRPLSDEMNSQNIPHLLYYGNIAVKQRDSSVSSYLSGEKKIMLLSPIGFEGLDLYGTTNVIILDPHYNPERTTQLISRAVRAFSSVNQIDVLQLLSVSRSLKGKIIDESVIAIAGRKAKLATLLKTVLTLSGEKGQS